MNRRDFGLSMAALMAGSNLAVEAAAQGAPPPLHDPNAAEKPVQHIAMVLYPGFFALDLVGPYAALAGMMGVKVHLVAKTLEPVVATPGAFPIVPSTTYADCPKDLAVLFVPGGAGGTVTAMEDPELIAFLKDRGSRATWVTSVCTGSTVLGASGLLRGYKATSHWVLRDSVLPILGATPVKARWVEDRNRLTGAGVSAGIDFGLVLVAKMRGEAYAQATQLNIEYDPQPPFHAGSPETAPPEILKQLTALYGPLVPNAQAAAERAKAKFG